MAAVRGLGKQVKTFVSSVPQTDLSAKQEKIVVYFKADTGNFQIEIPEHIADFIGGRSDVKVDQYQPHARTVCANTLEKTISGFNALLATYDKLMKNISREKVIVITFKANISPTKLAGHRIQPSEMFSTPRPALCLTYEILWRVDKGLYRESGIDGDRLTYIRQDPTFGNDRGGRRETFVIDWTQEREDFFVNMDQAMTTLIQRICDMLFGDTAEAVDALIAGGGLLQLPAPETEASE